MKNTENAERPISAMVYSPSRRGPLRWPGRPAQNVFQLIDQGLQDRHAAIESKIVPRRQAKSSPVHGEAAKIRELLLVRLTLTVAAGSSEPAAGPTGNSGTRPIRIQNR